MDYSQGPAQEHNRQGRVGPAMVVEQRAIAIACFAAKMDDCFSPVSEMALERLRSCPMGH